MALFKKRRFLLFTIFILAIFLRFLFFPQNTYFGFDQARDAYAVKEILGGDLKIVGPPTANGVLHHGVLYYYIFAPFYLISQGDPAAVSFFLRILNAAGVFLIYPIGLELFGETAALLASFLFAISYEQSQFSLFLNHPSFVVISVLVFYLGLSYWIFKKRTWGFLTAFFGLGLSIQFEFVEVQLIAVFLLFILFFRREIPKLTLKNISLFFLAFILPLSSYIISEIKNNFLIVRQIPGMLGNSLGAGEGSSFPQIIFLINRFFQDNFFANTFIASILMVTFLVIISFLIIKNRFRQQFIFLFFWFFGGLIIYLLINNDAYFYNTGTSISLLVFTAFLLSKIFHKKILLAFFCIVLIIASNLYLIMKNNPLGPNQRINPQVGLLIEDEKKVIDFMYQRANAEEFAVNALTMPYNVNTTWSYLFEWYGKNKYGYVPTWGGDASDGFPGSLKVEKARSKLPAKRFLIIEPQEGIPTYIKDSFIANEEQYTNVVEKKKIGTIEIWVQQPK